MLINCLSEGVLVEFLSVWLGLSDVYNTDMAATSKKHREHFLTVLKNVRDIRFLSKDYVNNTCFEFGTFYSTKVHFVQWLDSRQIQQKLSVTLSPGSYCYLDRITYCFTQGKSYSVVSNLTISIDRGTSSRVPLSEIFHRIFQVFPEAAATILISKVDEHLFTELLELQSVINGNRVKSLQMKVDGHSPFESSWFQREFEEGHSPLMLEFYRVFGERIGDIESMYSSHSFSTSNIPFLVQHCPNLQAIPYRLNRTILSVYWQHLRHLNHIKSFELLFDVTDASEVGLVEEDDIGQTAVNSSVGSLTSLVLTYLHLKTVSLHSRNLSDVLQVFRHCQQLENFYVRSFDSTLLAWRKVAHDASSDIWCSSLTFGSLPAWLENAHVSLATWAAFLSKLTAFLKPLGLIVLLWFESTTYLEENDLSEYAAIFCSTLHLAPCCRQLKAMDLSPTAACFLGRSQCVFDSVTNLVVATDIFEFDASELTKSGTMMCVPNARSLELECHGLSGNDVISWIRCLPSLDRLLLSASGGFVTSELLAALTEGNRVWNVIHFHYLDAPYQMREEWLIRAIREQGLLVKKVEISDLEDVNCCWGDGLNILDSEVIASYSDVESASDSEDESDSDDESDSNSESI